MPIGLGLSRSFMWSRLHQLDPDHSLLAQLQEALQLWNGQAKFRILLLTKLQLHFERLLKCVCCVHVHAASCIIPFAHIISIYISQGNQSPFCCIYNWDFISRAFGLVVWFSLWVREVPSSILGMPPSNFSIFILSLTMIIFSPTIFNQASPNYLKLFLRISLFHF